MRIEDQELDKTAYKVLQGGFIVFLSIVTSFVIGAVYGYLVAPREIIETVTYKETQWCHPEDTEYVKWDGEYYYYGRKFDRVFYYYLNERLITFVPCDR